MQGQGTKKLLEIDKSGEKPYIRTGENNSGVKNCMQGFLALQWILRYFVLNRFIHLRFYIP